MQGVAGRLLDSVRTNLVYIITVISSKVALGPRATVKHEKLPFDLNPSN